MWGPRKSVVRVGDPLDLKDHLADYKADKRDTTRNVTTTLESSVRTMLSELAAEHGTPLRSG